MSNVYITAPDPNAWNRPGGWVEIPSISSLDTKFYGVYAVYENRKNNAYIGFAAGTFNCTINWGDGGADTTVSTLSTPSKTYTYASLTSPILERNTLSNFGEILFSKNSNSAVSTSRI